MTEQKERPAATPSVREPPVTGSSPAVAGDGAQLPASGSSAAPEAPPATDGTSPAAVAPAESSLRSSLSVLTTLGPPVTVVGALMLYFGWARTEEQAHAMGLDVSLFGYTTQDYVLRSVSSLYLPLLFLGALALGWLAVHQHVVRLLDHPGPHRRLRITGWSVMAAGLLAAAYVVWRAAGRGPLPLLLPLVLAGGVAAAAYGGWLARASAGPRAGPATLPWERALRTLLVSVVIALALFWQLSIYAGVVGRGYAEQTAQMVPQLPRATAFSPTPLGIEAPGVQQVPIDPGPSADTNAPRYRITGLRLLTVSGGRIFLLHDGWTPQNGTVIVLPDDQRVRWQFSR